jgi:hypothetical protein
MALIDNKLYFGAINLANGADVTAALGTPVIAGLEGNIVDIGAAGVDGWGTALGNEPGAQLFLNAVVTTVVGGEDGFIALCGDDTHDSTDIDAVVAENVYAMIYLNSGLVAGTRLSQNVLIGNTGTRYWQISAGAASSTGVVETWVSDSPVDSNIALK